MLLVCLSGTMATSVAAKAASPEQLRESARKGCDRGDMRSCRWYASDLEQGKGGPKNLKQAFNLFERGCIARDAAACYSYGRMLFNGSGVTRDREQGAAYILRSCVLDPSSKGSCKLATDVAVWRLENYSIPRLSMKFRSGLTLLNMQGMAGLSDKDLIEYVRFQVNALGCKAGSESACSSQALTELRLSYSGKGSRDRAVEIAEHGCRIGGTEACSTGARILMEFPAHPKGSDLYLRDIERAGSFIRTACRRSQSVCKFLKKMRKQALK